MSTHSSAKFSVLFVCLGNICRSPTAEGVFRQLVHAAGLSQQISVDSAGTAAFHIGKTPDHRSQAAASKRGYDLSRLKARQAISDDFHRFDYILAMDHHNMQHLHAIQPSDAKAQLKLFLDFAPEQPLREMPDPYYGGAKGFDLVLDLVEQGSHGLLAEIQQRLHA